MLRPLLESTGWAVVCCAVWLVTLSSVTLPELCFAAASSIPCGVLAWAGRRTLGASWRFRPQWLGWPVPVVATLLVELGELVATATWRPHTGRMRTIELPDEESELARGREAAATLALCSTPGTIVADNDPRTHLLTVHELLTLGPDLETVIGR